MGASGAVGWRKTAPCSCMQAMCYKRFMFDANGAKTVCRLILLQSLTRSYNVEAGVHLANIRGGRVF